jgi:uncharacterized protein HemX
MKNSGTANPMTHLTDDQFTECLINGAPAPEAREHLTHCDRCQQQVSHFLNSVGDFNAASLAWSESRPSTSLRAASTPPTRNQALAPLGWALAAAALLAVGVPAFQHDRPLTLTHNLAASVAPEDSEAQIAQDNDLLLSVNMALTQNAPSPIREYELTDEASQAPDARQESGIR